MEGQVTLFDLELWSGKTSQELSAQTTEKTSRPSSRKSSASGRRTLPTFHYLQKGSGRWQTPTTEMGGLLPTEFSMHSFGESPSVAVVSRLSQILEAMPHPKYSLSAKACKGILRRSERRGKKMPWLLDLALTLQSHSECEPDVPGGGKGPLIQIEKSGTLGCNNDQTIFCLMDQGGSVMETMMDKTGTLRAQEHGHQPIVLTFPEGVANTILAKAQLSYRGDQDTLVLTYDARGNGDGKTACTLTGDYQNRITDYTSLVLAFKAGQGAKAGGLGIQEDVAPTLTSAESGTNQVPVVLLVTPSVAAVDCRNGTVDPNFNGTLQAKSNGGQSLNLNNVVLTTAADGTILLDGHPCIVIRLCVRRLTPLECERLQGYPDGWTDIGPWVDSKGKLHKECSDSARYKALGNSIALPHWKWILKRISAIYEREATMASLFDGIGGFPLLWEQINGAGSCLWASEIEEFPMEVTRYRIGSGV